MDQADATLCYGLSDGRALFVPVRMGLADLQAKVRDSAVPVVAALEMNGRRVAILESGSIVVRRKRAG